MHDTNKNNIAQEILTIKSQDIFSNDEILFAVELILKDELQFNRDGIKPIKINNHIMNLLGGNTKILEIDNEDENAKYLIEYNLKQIKQYLTQEISLMFISKNYYISNYHIGDKNIELIKMETPISQSQIIKIIVNNIVIQIKTLLKFLNIFTEIDELQYQCYIPHNGDQIKNIFTTLHRLNILNMSSTINIYGRDKVLKEILQNE